MLDVFFPSVPVPLRLPRYYLPLSYFEFFEGAALALEGEHSMFTNIVTPIIVFYSTPTGGFRGPPDGALRMRWLANLAK